MTELSRTILAEATNPPLSLLQKKAQSALLDQIFEGDESLRDQAALEMHQMRQRLAGEAISPVEHLLVERIALCWLQLHSYEIMYQQMEHTNIAKEEFYLKRIDMTNRRCITALRTLAQIRRLQLPAIELNITPSASVPIGK